MTDDNSLVVIDDDDDDEDEDDGDGSSSNGILTNKEECGCFEFSIGVNKVKEVNILRDKVQELYGVKVQQDIKAKEMGRMDKVERQWFSILGPLENCRHAKAFILAQCDPGESAIFDFDPKLYNILSSESHKSKVEKESNTVLLFDKSNEGNVIIQGSDEMCVLVAMSLLEDTIYKTSVNVTSYREGEKKIVSQDENSGGMIVKREETCSYASENQMELDTLDLESDTGDVATNVMMSPDPEIQRLIKCAREKNYTDDEIREVLQKNQNVPQASEFIRALHTCRNLKTISDAESNNAPLGTNTSLAVKAEIDNATQKFESKNMDQTENNVTMLSDNYDLSVSNMCPKKNCITAQVKDNKSLSSPIPIGFSRYLPANLVKTKDPDVETLSGSSCGVSPANDLICISDSEECTEERTEKAEASQQRNRTLFIEQATASHLLKQNSNTQLNKSESASSSGNASAELSPSRRHRKKKKKKNKNTIDLVKDDNQLLKKYQDKVSDGPSGASVKASSSAEFQSAVSKTINSVSFQKKPGLISVPPGKFSGMPPIPVQPGPSMSYPLAPSATAPISSQWPGKPGSNHLRYVVIDGSNVAMSHGNGKSFSCRGIKIAVEDFRRRGHKEITVFVPQWRRQAPRFDENPIKDQHILEDLKEEGIMTFTPSRRIPGKKNIVCYDDRFILRLAEETDGVVVSNDNYRDLYMEKREWSKIIETRVLSYTFVGDRFMLPDDPLGRDGPNLDEFLSFPGKGVIQASASQTRVLLPDHHPVMHNAGVHSVPYLPMPPMATPAQRFGSPYQQSNMSMRKTNQDYPRFPLVSNVQPRFPFRTTSLPRYQVEQPTNVQRGLMPQPLSSYRANAPAYCQTVAFSAPHSVQNKPDKRQRLESETAKIRDILLEIFPNQEKQIDKLLREFEAEQDIAKLTEILLHRI